MHRLWDGMAAILLVDLPCVFVFQRAVMHSQFQAFVQRKFEQIDADGFTARYGQRVPLKTENEENRWRP